MTGEKLWSEIENFMLDYYYDTDNYCEDYIDVKYSKKALYDFLNKKIEEIRSDKEGKVERRKNATNKV